ncbi:hypothetical protein ACV0NZ_001734 [Campylobacter jejuni]|nr:hypothetical protein [Campylobacter jejuni]
MARIENADDLCKHFNISEDCKTEIHQLYNTHKDKFLRPVIAYFYAIKIQHENILINQYEHPKGTFYIKTSYFKIIYKKENLEIINIEWIDSKKL